MFVAIQVQLPSSVYGSGDEMLKGAEYSHSTDSHLPRFAEKTSATTDNVALLTVTYQLRLQGTDRYPH